MPLVECIPTSYKKKKSIGYAHEKGWKSKADPSLKPLLSNSSHAPLAGMLLQMPTCALFPRPVEQDFWNVNRLEHSHAIFATHEWVESFKM